MITIFTDGSSRGNPGPGGWGAVVVDSGSDAGSGAGQGNHAKITELGGREDHTTNNRMELMAAIGGIEYIGNISKISAADVADIAEVKINSDSSYVINGITKWVHGWVRKNWITSQKGEVMNRDLWKRLMSAVSMAENGGTKISWNYVGGHSGIVGNERCDEIATSFADGKPTELFLGPIADYSLKDILNLSKNADASAKKSKTKSAKSRSGAAAYSYVSAVDGVIETHKTWPECEARVKGARGAKYKKALSAADETEIIKTFK